MLLKSILSLGIYMGCKLRRRCMHCIHYIGRRYGGYCGLTREHVSPYETCEKFTPRKIATIIRILLGSG